MYQLQFKIIYLHLLSNFSLPSQKRGFLHKTGISFPHATLCTLECSTTASIRGPRNRGKFGDKYTSNRSQTILASGTGDPGWSRTQPDIVCCQASWLRSNKGSVGPLNHQFVITVEVPFKGISYMAFKTFEKTPI